MKDEAGFTMMETLCAMALVLVCAGAAAGLVYRARHSTERIKAHSADQFKRLVIERIIRESAEAVRVPYWEEATRAGSIAQSAIETALRAAGYRGALHSEPIYDRSDRLRGVHCRYDLEGRVYEGIGLFASIPLEREDR
jgi:prepilin-type N-terminal cleavage/methylation domain-containing protein